MAASLVVHIPVSTSDPAPFAEWAGELAVLAAWLEPKEFRRRMAIHAQLRFRWCAWCDSLIEIVIPRGDDVSFGVTQGSCDPCGRALRAGTWKKRSSL